MYQGALYFLSIISVAVGQPRFPLVYERVQLSRHGETSRKLLQIHTEIQTTQHCLQTEQKTGEGRAMAKTCELSQGHRPDFCECMISLKAWSVRFSDFFFLEM